MSSPQEQFAAAVRSTQAQAVDAVETWTKITQDAFGKFGDAPKSAPNPDQVIDQVFDFAEKMLEGQRDELESAGEKVRGQVEAGTEAARKQAETIRGQVEAGTDAARKQAEAVREQLEARMRSGERRPFCLRLFFARAG